MSAGNILWVLKYTIIHHFQVGADIANQKSYHDEKSAYIFYTSFLSPTDQKCAESSAFWQFFYYCPPSKFSYTAGEIVKMWCQEFDINILYIYIHITLSKIDMDFLYQFNLRLQQFWGVFFFNVKKNVFQKLAGLWLAGEVVNHVGLYGS